jgi:hypothetical protein
MRGVLNLAVIIAGGVMLANLTIHSEGTRTIFAGLANLWKISVNGMLGSTS